MDKRSGYQIQGMGRSSLKLLCFVVCIALSAQVVQAGCGDYLLHHRLTGHLGHEMVGTLNDLRGLLSLQAEGPSPPPSVPRVPLCSGPRCRGNSNDSLPPARRITLVPQQDVILSSLFSLSLVQAEPFQGAKYLVGMADVLHSRLDRPPRLV